MKCFAGEALFVHVTRCFVCYSQSQQSILNLISEFCYKICLIGTNLSRFDQFFRDFNVTLMILTNLRDNKAGIVAADPNVLGNLDFDHFNHC